MFKRPSEQVIFDDEDPFKNGVSSAFSHRRKINDCMKTADKSFPHGPQSQFIAI